MTVSCEIKRFIEDFQKNKIKFNKLIQQIKESGNKLVLTGANYSTGINEEETKIFAEAVNTLREAGADCYFMEGFTPEQAIDATSKLSKWADEIKEAKVNGKELSPYEKYLYAYEIASHYLYKNNNKGDAAASRNVVRVLNGDKIVCVGFSSLLKELCDRLGIKCRLVRTMAKSVKKGESQNGHMLCMIIIEDPKYDLDGVFYSDPTMGSPKEEHRRSFGGALIPYNKGKEVYLRYNQKFFSEQNEFLSLLREAGKITSKEENIILDTLNKEEQKNEQKNFIKMFREIYNNKLLFVSLYSELLKTKEDMNKSATKDYLEPEKHIDNFTKEFLKSLQNEKWRNMFLYNRVENVEYLYLLSNLYIETERLLKNKKLSVNKIEAEVKNKFDELSKLSDDEICKYVFGKSYLNAGENENKRIKKVNEKYINLENGINLEDNEKNAVLNEALKNVGLAMGKSEEEAVAYAKARRKFWTLNQEKEYAQCLRDGKSEEDLAKIEEDFNKDSLSANERELNHENINIESNQDKNANLDKENKEQILEENAEEDKSSLDGKNNEQRNSFDEDDLIM